MNRREFLQRFGAVPIAAALLLPETRTIFLPPRGGWPVGDFDTATMRYKAIERYSAAWTDSRFSNALGPDAALTEEALDRMFQEMLYYNERGRRIVLRPMKVYWRG